MPATRRARPALADLPSALRALAEPSRLAILLLLERRPRTVGEVVLRSALSQPTVSRHLQTLAAAGLVELGIGREGDQAAWARTHRASRSQGARWRTAG